MKNQYHARCGATVGAGACSLAAQKGQNFA
jgi:hypothetical protein